MLSILNKEVVEFNSRRNEHSGSLFLFLLLKTVVKDQGSFHLF